MKLIELEKFKLNNLYQRYQEFIFYINKIEGILETFRINLENIDLLCKDINNNIFKNFYNEELIKQKQISHDLSYYKLTCKKFDEFNKFLDSFLEIKNIYSQRIISFFLGLFTFFSILQIFQNFFKNVYQIFNLILIFFCFYLILHFFIYNIFNFKKRNNKKN